MPSTKSSPEDSGTTTEKYNGFTAEERAAMKEHAREEKKAAARRGSSRAEKEAAAERDVLAKIAEMPEADRVLAERIHEIVKAAAPDLAPKLWYGMPAYARDGKVVCHFQSAEKFKSRYATLGFSDQAALDDGTMWPTAYAVRELTTADEERISALVKKAVG
ncbi:iron chaperone [Streptomyces sp. NPDC086766]|uniref:iron chaperone n=1 Tax=Streptomyces sp. NPDC086766 TaxID=3365754 RepID=UPI0037F1D831